MSELSNCPFCNYEGNQIKECIERMLSGDDRVSFYIECFKCKIRTKSFISKKETIEMWNKRIGAH